MARTIKVTGIPSYVTPEDFTRLFEHDGCLEARLMGRQPEGDQLGYVEFQDSSSASNAIQQLQGHMGLGGKGLRLDQIASSLAQLTGTPAAGTGGAQKRGRDANAIPGGPQMQPQKLSRGNNGRPQASAEVASLLQGIDPSLLNGLLQPGGGGGGGSTMRGPAHVGYPPHQVSAEDEVPPPPPPPIHQPQQHQPRSPLKTPAPRAMQHAAAPSYHQYTSSAPQQHPTGVYQPEYVTAQPQQQQQRQTLPMTTAPSGYGTASLQNGHPGAPRYPPQPLQQQPQQPVQTYQQPAYQPAPVPYQQQHAPVPMQSYQQQQQPEYTLQPQQQVPAVQHQQYQPQSQQQQFQPPQQSSYAYAPPVAAPPAPAPLPQQPPQQQQHSGSSYPTAPLPSDASHTLYTEGFPDDVTKREMAHIFRHFQGFMGLRLVVKDSKKYVGEKLCMAFIEFDTIQNATDAMARLQGYIFDLDSQDAFRLHIKYAKPMENPRALAAVHARTGIGRVHGVEAELGTHSHLQHINPHGHSYGHDQGHGYSQSRRGDPHRGGGVGGHPSRNK